MISITDKKDCCGCSACVQRCPKQCISMQEDEEGFLYPVVDTAHCIDCGLCEKVCPVIHQDAPREPKSVYAAKNPDDSIRISSSSGGGFTLLAEQVIARGGVVFGARFDERWEVVHDYTETTDGLAAFRSSKYIQSRIAGAYIRVEAFLKQGRLVLFSGTPCQIAGLHRFLRRAYDNLLTVDVVCHSVPSPGIWRRYLAEKMTALGNPLSQISSVSFRDKSNSWKRYDVVVTLKDGSSHREPSSKNVFMRGFLNDLYTRPSCSSCPAKNGKSGSDLTLGDFWGIESLMPDFDDDRGVSVVLANTERGKAELDTLNLGYRTASYEDVVLRNPAINHSVPISKWRSVFYTGTDKSIKERVETLCTRSLRQRCIQLVYRFVRKTGLLNK